MGRGRFVIGKLQKAWKALRGNFWGALAFDVALMITAFVLISMWQTRNLPDDEHTPPLELAWLDDMRADTVMVSGETGVVYFFAPWCFYCRKSIDNLDELVSSGQLAWARVVALEYGSLDEVREFIDETGVHLPVLLGGPQTTKDWQIRGFPTYFVIDGDGKIASRSVGYSTKIGLQVRAWLNED
jgi:thiol-disulfide isomerase/thioredoxin